MRAGQRRRRRPRRKGPSRRQRRQSGPGQRRMRTYGLVGRAPEQWRPALLTPSHLRTPSGFRSPPSTWQQRLLAVAPEATPNCAVLCPVAAGLPAARRGLPVPQCCPMAPSPHAGGVHPIRRAAPHSCPVVRPPWVPTRTSSHPDNARPTPPLPHSCPATFAPMLVVRPPFPRTCTHPSNVRPISPLPQLSRNLCPRVVGAPSLSFPRTCTHPGYARPTPLFSQSCPARQPACPPSLTPASRAPSTSWCGGLTARARRAASAGATPSRSVPAPSHACAPLLLPRMGVHVASRGSDVAPRPVPWGCFIWQPCRLGPPSDRQEQQEQEQEQQQEQEQEQQEQNLHPPA